MIFQTDICQDFINTECHRGGFEEQAVMGREGERPGQQTPGKTFVCGCLAVTCTQSGPALLCQAQPLLTVHGEESHSVKGPEWEDKSRPWEQVLWVISSHWQIYLFCLHLCYQGPGRNSFQNTLWHVLVSSYWEMMLLFGVIGSVSANTYFI